MIASEALARLDRVLSRSATHPADMLRLRLARHLVPLEGGPQYPVALGAAVGLHHTAVSRLTRGHAWFRQEPDGRLHLTAAGQSAVVHDALAASSSTTTADWPGEPQDQDALRRRIVHLLAVTGPCRPRQIGAALGKRPGTVGMVVLGHPWFRRPNDRVHLTVLAVTEVLRPQHCQVATTNAQVMKPAKGDSE